MDVITTAEMALLEQASEAFDNTVFMPGSEEEARILGWFLEWASPPRILKIAKTLTLGERRLLSAINALMLERRALRAFGAALGMPNEVSMARRHELSLEHRRLEGEARRACRAAGIELRNNDQPFVGIDLPLQPPAPSAL